MNILLISLERRYSEGKTKKIFKNKPFKGIWKKKLQ
jgi:hypothetical protein